MCWTTSAVHMTFLLGVLAGLIGGLAIGYRVWGGPAVPLSEAGHAAYKSNTEAGTK